MRSDLILLQGDAPEQNGPAGELNRLDQAKAASRLTLFEDHVSGFKGRDGGAPGDGSKMLRHHTPE